MTNQLLSLFANAEIALKLIIVMLVLIGIINICIYIPQMRPVIAIIACVTMVFIGGYTLYYDIKYLTAESMTVGEVLETAFKETEIVEKDDDSTITTWSFTNIAFNRASENTYTASKVTAGNTAFDFENNQYVVLINNEKCFVNENGGTSENPFVKSQFHYSFYDDENNLLLSDVLYINFSFHRLETEVTIITYGGETAVNLWQAFKAKNGLNISLEKDSIEDFEEINVHDFSFISGRYKWDIFGTPVFDIDFENRTFSAQFTLATYVGTIEIYKNRIDFNGEFTTTYVVDWNYYAVMIADDAFELYSTIDNQLVHIYELIN